MTRPSGSLWQRLGPAIAQRWAATSVACFGGWRRKSRATESGDDGADKSESNLDPRVASAYASFPKPDVATNLDERQLALPELFDARDLPKFLADNPPLEGELEIAQSEQLNGEAEVKAEDEFETVPAPARASRFDARALRSSAEFEIAAASAVVVGLIFLVLAMAGLMLSRPAAERDLAAEIAQRRAEQPSFRAPAPCVKRPCVETAENPPQIVAEPPVRGAAKPPATGATAPVADAQAPAPERANPPTEADLAALGIVVDAAPPDVALNSAATPLSVTAWVVGHHDIRSDGAEIKFDAPAAIEIDAGARTLEWQASAPEAQDASGSLPNFTSSPLAKKSIETAKPVRKRATRRTAKRGKPPPAVAPQPAVVAQPAPAPEPEEVAKPAPPKLGSAKWPPGWTLWPTKPAEPAEPAPSFGFGGN